ncbi:beta-phosphoglucomutase family hydrolase [Micromonospora thermarum]|uniref:Beta-phosphoglucomutase n=1 Tax=Micromonospora thermarum TaxID=2720024 RepID=A0ABX0Z461_9ACTN|nr:beta-phosphoglucomutase family hydrolase [Micromonospora thermarum]NJP31129.1 beta-phosphoglucomutase family hydrolase [Micromonospora thermarum]
MLGLPAHVTACLFDLDGVLTQTARVHNAAWTATFDEFLRRRAAATGEPFRPFDPGDDYNRYVDGRPRYDGVRTFLASRGIGLPEGEPGDPPGADTVHGVGNRKNVLLLETLRTSGVDVYPGSVAYLKAATAAGLRRAVVTASANGREVVAAAGLESLLEVRVDGLVARAEGLRGKPEPDTFLAGARLLGAEPADAAVFEDALAGVAAGRAGGFGYVVGVDRVGQADELRANGADVVVRDLAELLDAESAGPGRESTALARESSRMDRGPIVRDRETGA